MNQELSLALQTKQIVGREEELQAIRQAILDQPTTHVLVFRGPAGIGKTRILEEVGNPEGIFATDGVDFAWSGIIDLYHPETHSKSGIERAIIEGIAQSAPELEGHFKEYWKAREEFERLRQEMIAPGRLEALRAQLTDVFVGNYNQAAAQRRIVLAFDTAELIQFESDVIQHVCQAEEEVSVIKTWLMDIILQMRNTVVLLAGRNETKTQKKLWADLCSVFMRRAQENKFAFREPLDLEGFTLSESLAYFDELATAARANGREADAKRIEQLPVEVRQNIHECVEGRPVRLGLAIDLAVHGQDPNALFLTGIAWAQIVPKVIDGLERLEVGYPVRHILRYLAVARMGLDVPLLHHLEPDWSLENCQDRLNWMKGFSFVKTRSIKRDGGEEDLFFLHDEMYDLLDEYRVYPSRRRDEFVTLYSKIGDYYEQRLNEPAVSEEKEQDLKVKVIHYRLQENSRRGYEEYYAKWAEFAIKAHQVGFDMRMRDESLRFHNVLVNNVLVNQRLSDLQGLTRDVIDRDCAVRWIKRYIAKAQYRRAIEVAETILSFGPEPYCSLVEKPPRAVSAIEGPLRGDAHHIFGVDDPLFWAHLLTSYGEASLFYGAPEAQARRILEKAITLLEAITYSEELKQWWRIRILGRAHNRLGYLYWVARRYGLSNDYNHTALHYYRQLDIRDEMAETLNNAAYVYALLGDFSRAEKWIDDALELRRALGQAYPLALTLNTRGRIHLLAGEPHQALPRCQEALGICQQLEDWRGQGLACNALGSMYCTLGNLNRLGVYKFDQALDFYKEAEGALRKAVHIFSVEAPERVRLVEAHDELGSVYRDWAILLQGVGREAEAAQQFEQALEEFERALGVAGDDWPVDRADTHEDMADVFALQGQLNQAEEHLGKAEALVPTEYRLVEGQGFRDISEPVEGFWQLMGKIHIARGHNISAPIRGLESLTDEQESMLLDAVEQYALAVAYFLKYSPHLRLHREAFRAVYERLKKYRLERLEKAEKRVLEVANRFKVDLSPLVAEIEEALGLKAPPIRGLELA